MIDPAIQRIHDLERLRSLEMYARGKRRETRHRLVPVYLFAADIEALRRVLDKDQGREPR